VFFVVAFSDHAAAPFSQECVLIIERKPWYVNQGSTLPLSIPASSGQLPWQDQEPTGILWILSWERKNI
jgi:hypothetical protein